MKLGSKHTAETRRKMRFAARARRNPNVSNPFNGHKAKYRAVHMWVERNYGKSGTCEQCGQMGLSGHSIQWACLGDWKDRRRANWKRLCAKCHCEHDIYKKGRKGEKHLLRSVCLRGHPLSGQNLSVYRNGKRACKACSRLYARRRRTAFTS